VHTNQAGAVHAAWRSSQLGPVLPAQALHLAAALLAVQYALPPACKQSMQANLQAVTHPTQQAATAEALFNARTQCHLLRPLRQ
jgi:hypothetical protein